MEVSLPATLHKLASVSARTGLSRSALYREIYNSEKNPTGRLKVVRIGRSVRVREQDLTDFIDSLVTN
jgi:predicted DNA-binding transcriptional regulator AlpA